MTDAYSKDIQKIISLANRKGRVSRCVFCNAEIDKHDDPHEIGYAICDARRRKYVLWHVDCYCKNNQITRADYTRMER